MGRDKELSEYEGLIAAGLQEREARAVVRAHEIAAELLTKDPSLGVTAYVISNDMRQAEDASKRVAEGADPLDEINFVGSYTRFGWALDHLPREVFFEDIAYLWRGSDPDDTDPRFLAIWKEARERNGGYVYDLNPLPEHTETFYTVFRGQDENAEIGIAWSLDLEIAKAFAKGRGLRQRNRPGIILTGTVDQDDVLGYMTGRKESEIVVDPKNIVGLYEWGRWKRKGE